MAARVVVENIGQLATLAGPARPRVGDEMDELAVLSDAAMVVENGRIAWIGRQADLARMPSDEAMDAQGGVVLPGFVDAHAHPVFGGNRVDEFAMRASGKTYEDIAAAGGGIRNTMRKTRAASEVELFDAAKARLQWFLRGGTTTIEAKSGYGLSVEDEIKMLRVIRRLSAETPVEHVPTFLGAHAIPTEFEGDARSYVQLLIEEALPIVVREKLAEFVDAFFEQGYFDREMLTPYFSAAKSAGLTMRLHADQLTNSRGAEFCAEMGAKTADHLEQTDADGIAALAKSSIQPVLLPGSVYALGKSKYPDAPAMRAAGLAIVLATDFNPGSSPSPSMPMALSLACTHMKMSPESAICAATINAAYSVDRGHDRGSLEPGKRADFSIWKVSDYREIPYWFGVDHLRSTFVSGIYTRSTCLPL